MTEPLGIPVNVYHGCNTACHPDTCGPLYGSLCRGGKCCCKCHLTDNYIKHFQAIVSAVFEEGGDGDIVIFPAVADYELVASKFHAWLVFNYPNMTWVSKNEYSANRYVVYCGQPSSLSAFKSGENRGRRKPEKDGCWIHMSGYDYDAFSVVRAANNAWAKSLLKTGLRVGKLVGDGCVEFYVFQEGNKL